MARDRTTTHGVRLRGLLCGRNCMFGLCGRQSRRTDSCQNERSNWSKRPLPLSLRLVPALPAIPKRFRLWFSEMLAKSALRSTKRTSNDNTDGRSEDMTGTRVDTKAYKLWALDIGQHARDDKTEAMVEYVLNYQKDHGTWKTTVDRPPTEASNFTTNYVALRGLNRYGTAKQKEAIATRTTAVKQWLESANAVYTEDQVFRLRLAYELKLPSDQVDDFVQKLLSEQEADGGWAQNRRMKSDAYATGSVLVALHEAGGLSCQHPAWQRGLGYLLRTQQPDGSWHVVSRAKPLHGVFRERLSARKGSVHFSLCHRLGHRGAVDVPCTRAPLM